MDEPIDERAEKTLERRIRAHHWVRMLAELPGRVAGDPLEREAADRVESWMREIGFEEVHRTPVTSRPSAGIALALHLGMAGLGCWIGGTVGLLLAGVALLSFHREQRLGERGLSAQLGAVESQNVVARAGDARARRRVVITAHIDVSQAGQIFASGGVDRFARWLPRSLVASVASGSLVAFERTIWAAALVAAASALGGEGWLIAGARLAVGALSALGVVAMLEWAFAPSTPGANDNASGVAAMLTCGEQLLARLPSDVELTLVATGAHETGCRGARTFFAEHSDWPVDRTCYVNFSCVGGGALHWVRSEGALSRVVYPPTLTELARRLAHDGAFGDMTPVDLSRCTDGGVPAAHQRHTLSLIALGADGNPQGSRRAGDVAEAVDMEQVVRAADFADAVVVAWLRGDADPIALV